VEFARDGGWFACLVGGNLAVVESSSGRILFKLQQESDDSVVFEEDDLTTLSERFTTFAVHPDGKDIITASDNQLIRRWDVLAALEGSEGKPDMIKAWRGHSGPITCAEFHGQADLFATGSSDMTVKVWSMSGGYCTHNFRGHSSVVTFIGFHPNAGELRLCSGESNGGVQVWSLTSPAQHISLKNHVGAVTSICFCPLERSNKEVVITTGRDKVVNIWDGPKLLKSLPVMESIEGMVELPLTRKDWQEFAEIDQAQDCVVLATGGERGLVRLFLVKYEEEEVSMSVLRKQEPLGGDAKLMSPFTGIFLKREPEIEIVATTLDLLLHFVDPVKLSWRKQLIGFYDEILDVKAMPSGRKVAMTTNSSNAFLVDLETFASVSLVGHTDAILSVDVSKEGSLILTASKDSTIRVFESETNRCIAVGKGHTEAVARAVFLEINEGILMHLQRNSKGKRQRSDHNEAARKLTTPFVASVSADKSLKFWAIAMRSKDGNNLVCCHTKIAHDKGMNCIATSLNRMVVATGGQDRSIKLWNVDENFDAKGLLQGHRRGVWDVVFSPVEKNMLASASADKTLRIWSVAEMTCLSVLEGHTTSVLRVQFLGSGQRLASTASNGVLKVWSLKSTQCTGTMQSHRDKIWALTVLPPGTEKDANDRDSPTPITRELITGGADSRLVVWKDVSEELAEEAMAQSEAMILKEQELYSLLRKRDHLGAARIAVDLNRPALLRTTLEEMRVATDEDDNNASSLQAFVKSLDSEQLLHCWEWARDWNVYARNAPVAQLLISALLETKIPLSSSSKAKAILEPIRAYSQRHFQRLDRLKCDAFLVDHALSCMDVLDEIDEA